MVRRTGQDVEWDDSRDVWWHDSVEKASTEHECEFFDSEHPLYVMYTSGTTGKPKGILHTTGGYLVGTSYTHWAVFDLKADTDVYWCTADVGWVTGHSYMVYGPLSNAVTQVVYEGTPDSPHKGRWWEIIEKYGVTIFYTAPTAIRTFMKWGSDIPEKFDLSSIRVLGSVGEPINPEAYIWYRETIGGDRVPVVDTWWQTETGQIMISPLPGVTAGKPGSAMKALPGVGADVVNDEGESVPNGSGGFLVLTKPWPAMLRTLWGDDERFKETYWARFADQGFYFAGDGAKKDDDGDLWLLGRVDDVMNVSGHRLSTTEIESALVSHPKVAEAAVVGAADEMTGQAVCAFVILRESALTDDGSAPDELIEELRKHVQKEIGAIAKPRQIMIVPELPKTRSGKIMRRLLKDVAEHREVGDVTTLADSTVMDLIKKKEGAGSGGGLTRGSRRQPEPVAVAEDQPAEQGRDQRAREHGGLGGVALGAGERQVGHQQRHGEADAGEQGDADDVTPADRRVELGPGEAGDQPAAEHHADRLADHEARDHADDHRVADQLTAAGEHHAGGHQREERHREARGDRGQEVLEVLGGAGLLAVVAAYPGQQPQRDAGDGRVDAALVDRPPGQHRQRDVEQRAWSPAAVGAAPTRARPRSPRPARPGPGTR